MQPSCTIIKSESEPFLDAKRGRTWMRFDNQTNGLVSSVNEETALPVTEDLLVYQLLERQIFRNNGAMRTHGLRNGMARQQKHHLLYLDGSRIVEKPADERNPKSPTKTAGEHLPDTDRDEQEGKEPPDVCCDEGRPAHVSCDRPHDGSEDATAIEWVPRYQVEQHQGHIDVGQILGQTQQGLHASNQWLRRVEKDRQGETD